jgi:hypothetical protein
VYQHWDPLEACVVGRSYPPEAYSWITVPHVRSLFERIAQETEEDYQGIIKKLQEFNVTVLRPDLPEPAFVHNNFVPPPMTPRDHMIMVGDTFYENVNIVKNHFFTTFYESVRAPQWPNCNGLSEFFELPKSIQQECINVHGLDIHDPRYQDHVNHSYDKIFDHIRRQGNTIKSNVNDHINGAMVSRIGKDLFFGTRAYYQDQTEISKLANTEFPNTRNHIVNTGGHGDSTYCPVTPGLIISLYDVPSYADTYPGWEVVYLPNQSWNAVREFIELKKKNNGKWWIPGFERDQAVIDTVETWMNHWTGYVEETVFDVNMLIIDPKNVMVFNYNQQVFDALDRHGITAHVVPFRHRYFWDGGIHCVTTDLSRRGTMQDYFPERV